MVGALDQGEVAVFQRGADRAQLDEHDPGVVGGAVDRCGQVAAGDVVVIPAGVLHGWVEIPEQVRYLSIRPDPDRVLPAGYVNPAITR